MENSSSSFVQNQRSEKSNNRRPYRGGRNRGGRRYFHSSNGRRGPSRRGFKPSAIDPKRYIAAAQVSSACSLYDPNCKFDDFELADVIRANIKRKNFTRIMKIQAQTIPSSLSGHDILGLASTGSGKTAAFLIPMINKSLKDRAQKCLIITPTRELADQIQEEFYCFSRGSNMRSVLVIGGANIRKQIRGLRQNPQFVIATPGRLMDLERRNAINLSQFNNIVLDEVDRMLDMGFVNDIKLIISKLRPEKQSLFFAATMNPKTEEIARSFLKNPVRVQVEKISPQKSVDQDIVKVSPDKKLDKLHDLLNREEFRKVLIFSRTKWGSDKLSRKLAQKGLNVESIHGGKTQSRRERVISKFRQDQIKILVATDVAARGLDINDITHVINYDEPGSYDDYIHRIGRTGRAGKKGSALTFVA